MPSLLEKYLLGESDRKASIESYYENPRLTVPEDSFQAWSKTSPTVDSAVQDVFGMQPGISRPSILPLMKGQNGIEFVAPQFLYNAARAFVTPGVGMKGGEVSPEDALNFAGNVMVDSAAMSALPKEQQKIQQGPGTVYASGTYTKPEKIYYRGESYENPFNKHGLKWFTDSADNAAEYAKLRKGGWYIDSPDGPIQSGFSSKREAQDFIRAEGPDNGIVKRLQGSPRVISGPLDFSNPLVVDAGGANFGRIPRPKEFPRPPGGDEFLSTDALAIKAKAAGYDALIVKNVVDPIGNYLKPQTTVATWNKSASRRMK